MTVIGLTISLLVVAYAMTAVTVFVILDHTKPAAFPFCPACDGLGVCGTCDDCRGTGTLAGYCAARGYDLVPYATTEDLL